MPMDWMFEFLDYLGAGAKTVPQRSYSSWAVDAS